jgi:ABC-type lipoprotein release transport system permease subunit
LPQTLDNLRFVRPLPFLLAGFLLVLGVGAVGHSLVSAVRRRRHELAVLRTMGMTPRQAWASSAWQATALALVGVVVGVPLGLALGRVLWRWVAEAAPLYYVAPTAILVLVLALPITVLAANALAALPGRAAARLRPAHVLRTE